MVLKYTYQSDKCQLEAYQSYTIAQNSSLTNTVVITSTDPNAADYRYCLEFICYNYKGVPKTQYASPLLDYAEDGITFTIPASLTEYKGHVNMQITGYSTADKTLVFKSVNKGAKAFNVEGSLNVVENNIANVPNIFTEFFEELAYYRDQRAAFSEEIDAYKRQCDEIVQDAKDSVDAQVEVALQTIEDYKTKCDEIVQGVKDGIDGQVESALQSVEEYKIKCDEIVQGVRDGVDGKIGDILDDVDRYKQQCDEIVQGIWSQVDEGIENIVNDIINEKVKTHAFHNVKFKIYGETIKSVSISEGLTIKPPIFTLPYGCEIVDGWYELDKDRLWNFDEDTVNTDIELSLNFMTSGVTFNPNGKVRDLGGATGNVYLPDYYNGKRVTNTESTVLNVSDDINVYLGHFFSYFLGVTALGNNTKNLYSPKDGNFSFRRNCLYSSKEKMEVEAVFFVPRTNISTLFIQPGCQYMMTYGISHNPSIKKIVIPSSMTVINNYAITNTGITSITIPSSIETLSSPAFFNNPNLTDVYIEGDLSAKIGGNTFLDTTVTPNRRPTLHVHAEYYNNYIKKGVHNYYTVEIIGKDYFDDNYAPKEQTE